MSMLSAQIDELRKAAEYYDGSEVAIIMRHAADTIWQLRDDLQRANAAVQDAEHDESMAWDRVRKTEAENAKLRELVRDMWRLIEDLDATPYVTERQGNNPAVTWLDEDWSVHELCEKRMRELGIEVDQ